MKKLFLKWHEDYGSYGGISYEGTKLAEELGEKLASIFKGKSVAFYSSEADRTYTTAKHVVKGAGLEDVSIFKQPTLNEGLELQVALQGLRAFIPDDVNLAFCVTHNPVIYKLRQHFGTVGLKAASGFFEKPYNYDGYEFPDWSFLKG